MSRLAKGIMAEAHTIFFEETNIEISLSIDRAIRRILKELSTNVFIDVPLKTPTNQQK